ncbi:sugar phosphate isomerase/epimerase family protein [Tellurirhabdus bombi]|uniref:sugar phosphate isomerase/epimerase family protein n=1 Tax=Tellurirhabdus bombi TaxID=2907205 RepID=UPI001F2BB988|nr:sugar phosphate isomerase/epimerase [Tellurirhabdus bombi]
MKRIIPLLVCLFVYYGTAFAQSFSKTLKETPGMVSYTFRNQFAKDVPGTLDKIKAMGVTNMEMSNLFGKQASEIRTWLDERGMRCTSYGVNYDDLANKMETVIQNAKALGAKYVRVAWIPHKGAMDLAGIQKAAADFNKFGEQLHNSGLTFVYHNHGYEFQPHEKGTLFDVLMKETKPEYVSYEMDILWVFFPGQDPAALLKKYPKRFKLMHLKDLKKGVEGNLSGGTPPDNDVALGTGQINLPAVLKAARKSSIEFFYIEDESSSAEQQVPQSIAYLKTI